MSLFLGKIHYWLYNKIVWAEKAEGDMLKWAASQGLAADIWEQQFQREYGQPTGNRPLEEIIDTANIHGWLQERIRSVELRQAALVTAVLRENPSHKDSLLKIFKNQGEAAALEYKTPSEGTEEVRFSAGVETPEGVYNALNDFVLEGMPCDRGSQVIQNTEDELIWQTAAELHEPYWKQAGGDLGNFFALREAWISSFIKTLNPALRFEERNEGEYSITKK